MWFNVPKTNVRLPDGDRAYKAIMAKSKEYLFSPEMDKAIEDARVAMEKIPKEVRDQYGTGRYEALKVKQTCPHCGK